MPSNRLWRVAAALAAALTISSCGGAPTPSAAAFCSEIAANRNIIVSPTVAVDLDVTDLVELHQRLEGLAPLAVAAEWTTITDAIETASTVVPGDPSSVQRAVDAAYRSETAAVTVAEWVLASCGVDLGPVSTIAPHDQPQPATPVGSEN